MGTPEGANVAARGTTNAPGSLPPLVSAALDDFDSLDERLAQIAEHSPAPGRYTVLGELAAGAMGRILRVWDEDLQRELAMKVVSLDAESALNRVELDHHRRGISRFVVEARITGQLDHPSIVPVHEVAIDGDRHLYFTMPLVRGNNLKQVLELVRTGSEGWTQHRALGVIHKVCLAVAFAHTKGVLHRDLKPENVMIGRFGEVYVMDWGLALVLGRRDKAVVGTPAYMSPEQAGGKHDLVGPPTDVYSVGAILYELLGHHVPHELSFHDKTYPDRHIEDVIAWPPRPLLEIAPDVPLELVAVCEKAMAAEPEDRYSDMMEMANDLEAWLEGRVVDAYESGVWMRIRKWRARNRGLARALDGLAALFLISVALVVFMQQSTIRTVNAKNDEIELRGYVASVAAADLGLRSLEIREAVRRLQACPEITRGWEWDHLLLRSDVSTGLIGTHRSAVRSLSVSADGRLLATGTDEGKIRLFEIETGAEVSTLEGHDRVVHDLEFSPSGGLLASCSQDGSVRLWDVGQGRELRSLETPLVRSLSFSHDGSTLSTGGFYGGIQVWSVPEGELLAEIEAPPLLALDHDRTTGHLIAGHKEGYVRVWNPSLSRKENERFVGNEAVRALAEHPRGLMIAVAVGNRVTLLEPRTLTPILPPLEGHLRPVNAVAFDRHGERLLTVSEDETIRLWDTVSGTELATFLGHRGEVATVIFLPDGKHFASGSEDGTARLWNVDGRADLTLSGHEDWVTSLSFRSDGQRLISGSRDATLRIWDVAEGSALSRIDAPGVVECVAYGAGDMIAFGSDEPRIRVGRADAATLWRILPGRKGFPLSVVHSVNTDAVFSRDWKAVQVWRTSTGESLLEVEEADAELGTLAVHPDGGSFAVGDETGAVRVRDARTGELRMELSGNASHITALAYSSDGALLAAGTEDSHVLLWSTGSGELVHRLSEHEKEVTALAFHPSENRLASGSIDQTVRLWDPVSGESLLTLHGHSMGVTAVAFSPDGKLLASASKDRTIHLWRTPASPERD